MDLGDEDKSPFGSGTYRLTLVLPEKEKRYAIGLVEVFSSYNLYVKRKSDRTDGNRIRRIIRNRYRTEFLHLREKELWR